MWLRVLLAYTRVAYSPSSKYALNPTAGPHHPGVEFLCENHYSCESLDHDGMLIEALYNSVILLVNVSRYTYVSRRMTIEVLD